MKTKTKGCYRTWKMSWIFIESRNTLLAGFEDIINDTTQWQNKKGIKLKL